MLPYYFQILLFSTLIFLSFIIVFKTFPIGNEYKYFFLFFIAFVFQHHLGEFKFSIFEMFFLSFALFASKTKNFLLFNNLLKKSLTKSKPGTNINSIMDYDQDYVNKWSTCSVSDFKNWYYDVVNDFGEWCLT